MATACCVLWSAANEHRAFEGAVRWRSLWQSPKAFGEDSYRAAMWLEAKAVEPSGFDQATPLALNQARQRFQPSSAASLR